LSAHGQFLEHAPYCERDLRGPDGPLTAEGEDVPVIVRNRGGLTRLSYAFHPFDVVGWDGYLYPYAFNIADFEPIVKRTHAPPPVHQTFEGPNFVICSSSRLRPGSRADPLQPPQRGLRRDDVLRRR
jgi:homogentisate 1,2-dioxygenase